MIKGWHHVCNLAMEPSINCAFENGKSSPCQAMSMFHQMGMVSRHLPCACYVRDSSIWKCRAMMPAHHHIEQAVLRARGYTRVILHDGQLSKLVSKELPSATPCM